MFIIPSPKPKAELTKAAKQVLQSMMIKSSMGIGFGLGGKYRNWDWKKYAENKKVKWGWTDEQSISLLNFVL